jgi:anaerobic glycerol-3-phosphate dehydrogenase
MEDIMITNNDLKLRFAPSATHVVIGSGPAGVSCAMALIRRNLKVLMIDVGQDLSIETKAIVEKLKYLPPQKWENADIQRFRSPVSASSSGAPQKLLFGSKHIFGSQYNSVH